MRGSVCRVLGDSWPHRPETGVDGAAHDDGCGSPARALEICYWSREPGLIEIIRAIVSMPEKTRAAIEAFIVLSGDCATVTAGLDHQGTLTLASAEAAKIAALAHYAAAHDVEDTHRLLN